MSLLRRWQEFKPVRAVIEDVFKLAKSFGLRRLHRYTRSVEVCSSECPFGWDRCSSGIQGKEGVAEVS